jgi:hypothetical protein
MILDKAKYFYEIILCKKEWSVEEIIEEFDLN